MIPIYHSKSPTLSEEGRQVLYNNLSKNLGGYAEQLRWCDKVCKLYPDNMCIRTIFRLLFIGADLCASLRACLLAKEEYERRYQIKYLWVNLHEAYKAIYNNDADANSYLAQFATAYPAALASTEYIQSTEKLKELEQAILKDLRKPRNSILHFDTDVCKTIDWLNEFNSEESSAHYCSEFLIVLNLLTRLCRKFIPIGICTPQEQECNDTSVQIMGLLRELLVKNEKLIQTMLNVMSSVSKDVKIGKLICLVRDIIPGAKQLRSVKVWNAGMLIQILRADLAAALLSGLRSGHEFECRLNMRRFWIIRYEGLSRLQEILKDLPDMERERLEIQDVVYTLDAQQRDAAAHYRYETIDYIPRAYKDCMQPLDTVFNVMEMLTFLNQLNKLRMQVVR